MSYPDAGLFRLISLSVHERHDGPAREREHQHPVYHLVIFSQAENEFILGGRKMSSTRGLCVLTAPGESHCFLPRKAGATHYHAITFDYENRNAMPPWAALLGHYTGVTPETVPALIQIPEPHLLDLFPLVSRLHKSISGQGPVAARQIHFAIMRTFALVAEVLLEQQLQSHSLAPEIGARDYLDANFAKGMALAAVAAQAGVSPAHLGRVFKRRYGVSPGRYQDELRIDAACNLLRHSDLLVKEIAARLGYPDAYTFSKAFRRHCKNSPRVYRDHESI